VVALVIRWKRVKVTPPPPNQKECLKIFILDFGNTIPCLPWTIWCHVGTWCIMHGLSYKKVNSFFINHLHFSRVMKILQILHNLYVRKKSFYNGWKHTKAPKIVMTCIYFLQLMFLVMYEHHILDFFGLF
jgi:hypothetical protein